MKTIDIVKKRIIISMISILLLIITLFGITYAYFVSTVKGNENEESISVKAGKLELTYADGNGVLEVGKYLQPGEKVKFKDSNGNVVESKIFTVTNTGTRLVDSYEVILENVINELEFYEDLTYKLECISYINYGESNQEKSGTCNGNDNYFPKTNGVLTSNSIEVDVTHYYVLTLEYAETHKDQSDDMKKNISAKINVQDNESSLKNLVIYGNSMQNGTPSIDNPVEIKSLGDYDETTKKYKIPVRVVGKNLFDKESFLNSNYIGTYNGYNTREIKLEPNTTYKISVIKNNNYDGKSAYVLIHNQNIVNSTGWSAIAHVTSGTYSPVDFVYTTDGSGKLYIGESGSESSINEVWDNTDLQIEKGTHATLYEEFIEHLKFDIILDEPLRKVGEYVDYIDFYNNRLVRNVGILDNTGTLPLEDSLSGLTRAVQTNIELPMLIKENIGNIEILTEIEPSKIEY